MEAENKRTVENLSQLAEEHTQLLITKKYMDCAFQLRESIQQSQELLNQESSLWKNFLEKGKATKQPQNEGEWMKQMAPLATRLEDALRKVSHILHAFQQLPEYENLALYQHAIAQHRDFVTEIRCRVKERMESTFIRFEWPKPNHKLNNEIRPLQFRADESDDEDDFSVDSDADIVEVHSVNEFFKNHRSNALTRATFVTRVDQRVELFVALFLLGLRLQRALDIQSIIPSQKSGDGTPWDTVESMNREIWVLDTLFGPVLSRFRYHFMSEESQTNQLEKPEWVFSYLGDLISDHAEFFLVYVQPLLNLEFADASVIPDAKNIFIKGLLDLLEKKLLEDLPVLLATNQSLYCHTLSEAVKIQRLLFDVHNYPPHARSPVQVFAYNEELLEAWVKIERHSKTVSMFLTETTP